MSQLIPMPSFYYSTNTDVNHLANAQKATTSLDKEEEDEKRLIETFIKEEKQWEEDLSRQQKQHKHESLFVLPLDKQIEAMKNNRAYLQSLNFESQVLALPDICIQKAQLIRFTFENGFLKVVNRIEQSKKYLDKIISKMIQRRACYYFYGCSGTGKSHFLYLLACQLMKCDNYTVVYVPSCSSGLIKDVLEALYVSCMASNEAKHLKKQLDKVKKVINEFKRSSRFDREECIRQLKKNMKNRLIFIIDQINELLGKKESEEFEFLQDFLVKRQNIIFSGSENNQVESIKLDSLADRIRESFTFEEKEIRAFIKVRNKSIRDYGANLKEIAKITGGFPIEIERFLAVDASSINQRFWIYSKQFNNVYNANNLKEWFKKQDDKKIVVENIIKCLTNVSVESSYIENFDKRIIIIKEEIEENGIDSYFKPITTLAYRCILNAYISLIRDCEVLLNRFHEVMKADFLTNAVSRGFYMEAHLILLIKLESIKYLQVVPMIKNGDRLEEKEAVEVVLKDLNLYMLHSRMAPDLAREKINRNTLFVPVTYNSGYDFIILDAAQKHLYYFNVTLMENPKKHLVKNDMSAESNENSQLRKTISSWIKLFPLDRYHHFDIFVLPKSNVGPFNRSTNLVFLEDIAEKNPNLEYISNYFKNQSLIIKNQSTENQATNQESAKRNLSSMNGTDVKTEKEDSQVNSKKKENK